MLFVKNIGVIMIEIKEVKTKKDIKNFVRFPIKLYEGNKYYVPNLEIDEINKFDSRKNESWDECDIIAFLAYKDGKIVGRVAGIIQNTYNQSHNEKRVRFSRFDSIDDVEVAKALLNAVESWAKAKGMTVAHGPMGYNDLDREGLLIEGFDQYQTFEEQYNYDYYPKLIEACGYKKEVDWLEYRLFTPKEPNERAHRFADVVMKRYKLHLAHPKNMKEVVNKYADGIFEVLEKAYEPLYGVVSLSKKVRKALIGQFNLILDVKYLIIILNEKEEVVSFGLAFPSLSEAVTKSKGRLFPFGLFRILKAIRKPKVVDLGLIGVLPEYQNRGLNAIILNYLITNMIKNGVEAAETNLMLEDNSRIQNQWDAFDHIQHKRRRAYVKNLVEEPKPEKKTAAKKYTKTTKCKTEKSAPKVVKKTTTKKATTK